MAPAPDADARAPAEGDTLSDPSRIAVVGLGYWGPNLVRNLHEVPKAPRRLWSATCGRRRSTTIQRRYPAVADDDRLRHGARRPDDRRGRDRNAGLDAISRSRPAALEAGKHVFVEKPLAASSDEALELIELADEHGLVLMPGHTFLYSPPVNMIRALIDARRARRDLLHLDEPREPRPAPARRQRRLGSRAARLLDPSLLARRDAFARERAQPRLRHPRRLRTWRSSTSSSRRGRSRTSSSRGSRRASCGGRRSSARGRWSSTTTRRNEPVRVFDSGVMLRDPETFGEYQLTYRTGDIVSPHMEVAEPLKLELEDFCTGDPHRIDAALVPRAGPRGGQDDRSCRRIAREQRRPRGGGDRAEPHVSEALLRGRAGRKRH